MPDRRTRLVDVSHHQPPPSLRWAEWWALDFRGAIIRAGIGEDVDEQREPHRERARAAGYKTGRYWYLKHQYSPAHQARLLLRELPADDELGAWLDVEQAGLTEWHVREYVAEWRRITTRGLGIYTSAARWHDIVGRGARAWCEGLPLWVAAYPHDSRNDRPQPMDPVSVELRSTPPTDRQPDLPDPWATRGYLYWQHTGHGRLPGYENDLDLNICPAWPFAAPPPEGVDMDEPTRVALLELVTEAKSAGEHLIVLADTILPLLLPPGEDPPEPPLWWVAWPEGVIDPKRALAIPDAVIEFFHGDGTPFVPAKKREVKWVMYVTERRGPMLLVFDTTGTMSDLWVRVGDVKPALPA